MLVLGHRSAHAAVNRSASRRRSSLRYVPTSVGPDGLRCNTTTRRSSASLESFVGVTVCRGDFLARHFLRMLVRFFVDYGEAFAILRMSDDGELAACCCCRWRKSDQEPQLIERSRAPRWISGIRCRARRTAARAIGNFVGGAGFVPSLRRPSRPRRSTLPTRADVHDPIFPGAVAASSPCRRS